MSFANPRYLVETGWLAEHLKDEDLRILDCMTCVIRMRDRVSVSKAEGRPGPGSTFPAPGLRT